MTNGFASLRSFSDSCLLALLRGESELILLPLRILVFITRVTLHYSPAHFALHTSFRQRSTAVYRGLQAPALPLSFAKFTLGTLTSTHNVKHKKKVQDRDRPWSTAVDRDQCTSTHNVKPKKKVQDRGRPWSTGVCSLPSVAFFEFRKVYTR